MSIYSSIFDIGDEHKNICRRMKRLRRGVYEYDDDKPCSCGSAPIEYEGSHILPSLKDKRAGVLGFAAIRGHITRDGRDNGKKEFWPYLRFHLNALSLVITRHQAIKLRDALTEWLDYFE